MTGCQVEGKQDLFYSLTDKRGKDKNEMFAFPPPSGHLFWVFISSVQWNGKKKKKEILNLNCLGRSTFSHVALHITSVLFLPMMTAFSPGLATAQVSHSLFNVKNGLDLPNTKDVRCEVDREERLTFPVLSHAASKRRRSFVQAAYWVCRPPVGGHHVHGGQRGGRTVDLLSLSRFMCFDEFAHSVKWWCWFSSM